MHSFIPITGVVRGDTGYGWSDFVDRHKSYVVAVELQKLESLRKNCITSIEKDIFLPGIPVIILAFAAAVSVMWDAAETALVFAILFVISLLLYLRYQK